MANFRNGGAAGPIQFQVQVPANSSSAEAFPQPNLPVFPGGLYVEKVSGTLNAGNVDLV